MKKVFFLTALLCASVMSFAAKFCEVATGHLNDPDFGDPNGRILLTIEPTGNANEFRLAIKPNAVGNKLDVLYAIIGDGSTTNPYPITVGSDVATGGEDELSATFTYTGSNQKMTIQWSHPGWDGRWQCEIDGIDYTALVSCSAASKLSPELELNASEKTLDAASSQTFQIEPQQIGDGEITYESSNPGIASVSDAGLVTAVGRGTAVITVKTAETAAYDADSKNITITVTGPINWEAISWLAGSDDKYKVVSEPEIADKFGGKHIEPGNLWIGFPSADFGDNSSIEHTAIGAGVKFPLSQFTKEYNTFNFICAGVTYAITLYYVDGTKEATAIYNAIEQGQAMKVLENGQLVIIRNGVRYNAAGQYLK